MNCTVAFEIGVPFKFLNVATSFCVAPTGSGPLISVLKVNLEAGTVNATVAVAFDTPSALLIAVTITVCPATIWLGALYNPAGEIVPVPAGLTVQRTLVFGSPETAPVNCCVCCAASVTVVGFTLIDTGGYTLIVAVAESTASPGSIAFTVTVCREASVGAVYTPAAEIVPRLGVSVQLALATGAPLAVSASCSICPGCSVDVAGAMDRLTVDCATETLSKVELSTLPLTEVIAIPTSSADGRPSVVLFTFTQVTPSDDVNKPKLFPVRTIFIHG